MYGGLHLKAVVVAMSVLVAACGGGGDDKAATTGGTQPGETTTVPPGADDGAQVDGGGAAASGGAGGTATTTPGASASPSGGSGATSSGSSGGSTATTTPTKGGSAVAAKSAKPGGYTYNRTGNRTVTGLGDQSLNGQGTLTVDPPGGSDQRTLLSFNPYDSAEQVLRYRAGGIDLVMLKLETQLGTFEFRPDPPVFFAPDPLAVGATWAWKMTSTDGRLTLDSSFKIVRTETQTIGNEAVATFVVEGTTNASGVVTGTTRQTLWASDRHRLVVRVDETSDFGNVKSQSSSVLASTTPA